jgi:hypothetical protein
MPEEVNTGGNKKFVYNNENYKLSSKELSNLKKAYKEAKEN